MAPVEPIIEDEGLLVILDLGASRRPWPLPQEEMLFERDTQLGRLAVYSQPDGSLRIVQGDGENVKLHDTARIAIDKSELIRVAINFNAKVLHVAAAGASIYNSELKTLVDFEVSNSSYVPHEPPHDLQQLNLAALVARVAARRARQPKPGRRARSISELKEALHGEIRQLRELVKFIEAGETFHFPGLLSRIRLLISPSRTQNPLLQEVAAAEECPLLVWVTVITRPPIIPGDSKPVLDWHQTLHIPGQQPVEAFLMDLDVWLAEPGAEIGSRIYSNNKVLKSFADTEGSHLDPDVDALFEEVSRQKAAIKDGQIVLVPVAWAINVARVIDNLACEFLGVPRD